MLRYGAPTHRTPVSLAGRCHDKPGRIVRPRHLSLACAIAASAVLPSIGSSAAASPSFTATSAIASRSVALAQPAEPAPTQKDQLLWITNAERARVGLGPLVLREGVADVARQWAAHLAGDLRLSHRSDLGGALNGAGVTGWRASGENVGSGPHVSDVHRAFMASSAHRAILLSPAYSQVGIGVTAAGGRVWVTVNFVG